MDSPTQFGKSSASCMGRSRSEITSRAQYECESEEIFGSCSAYHGMFMLSLLLNYTALNKCCFLHEMKQTRIYFILLY